MESLAAALDVLKKSCGDYEASLRRSLDSNAALKVKVKHMVEALEQMKRVFSNDHKCGICCSRAVDTALDCGHCLCIVCSLRALRAEKCPYCRKVIKESKRLYL